MPWIDNLPVQVNDLTDTEKSRICDIIESYDYYINVICTSASLGIEGLLENENIDKPSVEHISRFLELNLSMIFLLCLFILNAY